MIKIHDINTSDVTVRKIGPSTYTSLKNGCKYSYFLTHTRTKEPGTILPCHNSTLLGTVIHALFEERAKGMIQNEDDFERRWEAKLTEKENEIKQMYGLKDFSMKDYDRMYLAMGTAMNMRAGNVGHSVPGLPSTRVESEKPYETDNLIGTIDRIENTDGKVKIIDFKTGHIINEATGNIKEEYVAQLNLYASMFVEKENMPVDSLEIMDTSGNTFPVPMWSDAQLKSTLKDIDDLISLMNSTASKESLAAVSDKCGMCSAKMICEPYWRGLHKEEKDDEDPESVFSDLEINVTGIENEDVISYSEGRITGASKFTFRFTIGARYRIRGLIYKGDDYEFGKLYLVCSHTIIMKLV